MSTLQEVQAAEVEMQAALDRFMEIARQYQMSAEQRSVWVQIPRTELILRSGEEYIGSIIDADGSAHAIILLPGDQNDINWAAAKTWAASIGGSLPTRIEQAMLYAAHRDKFERRAYWSCEQTAEVADYAWSQNFGFGGQYYYLLADYGLRARAVRRVSL